MLLSQYFTHFLSAIETEMRHVVAPSNDPALTTFYGMLHYHLGWVDAGFAPAQFDAGKRIRPVLTLLTCEASAATGTTPCLPRQRSNCYTTSR